MNRYDAAPDAPHHSPLETWLRVGLCALTVWAVFRFVVEPRVLAYESHYDPLVLHAGRFGLLGGIAIAGLLRLSVGGATAITGGAARGVVAVCLGLMAWALRDQTIDQWLIARNPSLSQPTGAVYWPLLLDFLLLAIGLVPLPFAKSLFDPPQSAAADLDQTAGPADWRGLLATLVLGVIVVPFLMGPAVADTRVKQVYFAVAAGLPLARWGARKLTNVQSIGGAWVVPFLLGMIGVAVAAMRPAFSLPAGYQSLTETPAWGLVRPLPLQWISLGLATILWNVAFPIRASAATAQPVPAAAKTS
ncbi:MAG: hypothetical protein SF069_15195 [Phycisphaerae bacterium]|nr:hypothetical protein [Phycisphaerae bacterium]